MCSKARCSATRTGCASTRNSSTRESGAHLWADRFEEDVADLFKLQDQVVARLANALGYELVKAEAETGARSKNPDAIDLDMRGSRGELALRAASNEGRQSMRCAPCSNRRSRSTRTMPMRWRATPMPICSNTPLSDGRTPKPTTMQRCSGRPTDPSRSLRDNAFAYQVKSGYYLLVSHRPEEALRAADAALAINPNAAYPHTRTSDRRNLFAPIRTSEIRCAAGDAAQSARSGHWGMAQLHGRRRTRARTFRRRDRRKQQSDRRRLSRLLLLPEFGRRPRAQRRYRRSQNRFRRSSPPQSQSSASNG